MAFILLNPSTADAEVDDSTLGKCAQFARSWGYGSLILVNLFAYRATHPEDLMQATNPVGEGNDASIQQAAKGAERLVVAWGNDGTFQHRDQQVLQLLASYPLSCLGGPRQGGPGILCD